MRYGHGGAGHHVQSLANELVAKGHEVDIFCGRNLSSPNDPSEGLRVYDLGISFQYGSPSWWSHRLRRILRRDFRRPLKDLDVLNGNPVSGDLARFSKHLGIPYVTTLHGSLRGMLKAERQLEGPHFSVVQAVDRLYKTIDSRIERREYIESDHVIVVSASVLREYEESYGRKGSKSIIPPCPDRAFFSDEHDDAHLPVDVRGWDCSYVLFVGSSLARKGFRYLAQAFQILGTNISNARLVVAAGGPDPVLRSIVREGSLSEATTLLEHRLTTHELKELMYHASVLAVPSVYEGFGLVVTEAASQELPAVGFETTGLTNAIRDGQTGIKVPVGDIRGLSRAIETVLMDKGLREEMGREAGRMARAHYAPDGVAKAYIAAYGGLARNKPLADPSYGSLP